MNSDRKAVNLQKGSVASMVLEILTPEGLTPGRTPFIRCLSKQILVHANRQHASTKINYTRAYAKFKFCAVRMGFPRAVIFGKGFLGPKFGAAQR